MEDKIEFITQVPGRIREPFALTVLYNPTFTPNKSLGRVRDFEGCGSYLPDDQRIAGGAERWVAGYVTGYDINGIKRSIPVFHWEARIY